MPLVVFLVAVLLCLPHVARAYFGDNISLIGPENKLKELIYIGSSRVDNLSQPFYLGALYSENGSAEFSPDYAMAMDLYILADKVSYRSFNSHWRNGIAINSSETISSELTDQIAKFNQVFEDLLTKSELQFTDGDHIRFLFWPKKGVEVYLNKLKLLEMASDEFFPLLLSVWTGDVPLSSEIKQNINGTSGWQPDLSLLGSLNSLSSAKRSTLFREALQDSASTETAKEPTVTVVVTANPFTEERNIPKADARDSDFAKISAFDANDGEQQQESEQLKLALAQKKEQKAREKQKAKEKQKVAEARESLEAYFNNIRQAIQLKQNYPRMALRKNISGTVVVAINIKSDGDFDYHVSDSSGWDILDNAAIKTVKKVRGEFAGSNQLRALPQTLGIDQSEFKIPLIYSVSKLPR